MQQAVCVRRKKKNEIPPHPKHTTKSTAARRPRPPRDGVRRNTSHASAHNRTLSPYIPGLWKSASLVYTRMYILALLLLLRRLCTFWCSILFSGQRSFVFLCCDTRMYLRFRGCPVVLDIELSVSAWYHKTRRALLRARRLLLLLLTAEIRERRRAVCGVTFKLTST